MSTRGRSPHFKEETGNRYGKLMVIGLHEIRKRHNGKAAIWHCQCDCGNTVNVEGANLRLSTKSCGCLRGGKFKPNNEHVINKIINSILQRAKTRKIEFSISKEEILLLVFKNCTYCGISPQNVASYNGARQTNSINYSGLDRVDSNLGYIPGNCVPCCRFCNYAKNDISTEEFRSNIKRTYEHMFIKKENN